MLADEYDAAQQRGEVAGHGHRRRKGSCICKLLTVNLRTGFSRL